MTTPTLREAIDWLESLRPPLCDCEDCKARLKAKVDFAANTLRAIASAQSDAEADAEKFVNAYDYSSFLRPDDDEETCTLGYMVKQSYLAGHAQCAAGLAASPSDVSDHLQEMWRKSVCFLRDQLEAKKRALAAQEAKVKELERELRMYRDCADEEDEQQTELVDFFRKEFVREGQRGDDDGLTTEQCAIKVMREQSTALATAKAELAQKAEQNALYHDEQTMLCNLLSCDYTVIPQHVADVIRKRDAAKADALTLEGEVRRCHNIAKGGAYSDWCDSCNDIIEQSPAAVTAAMERYK